MRTDRYIVMSFGLGGNTGYGISQDGNTFTSQWYLKPENLQRMIGHKRGYTPEQLEGCILIDKCVVVEENPMLAIKSPMCNPKLNPGQIKRFGDLLEKANEFVVAGIATAFIESGNGAAILAGTCGGLDEVAPADYVAWWQVVGARIGKVVQGNVIWS